ncbi:homocysteine S-methyltransferase family protein [Marinomonas sp. A79]|uniref:Homocysteine S-methyltransferase family protein n=1 Tax=Marinomonas vulgaris TaxID=2823372 RepID=A0ABS5HFC7_9GAMM|nr:homocysteine S-methyltransferase family protein [Marinomonas vulgaris]MBR7890300.1 homocysteine S-methyltransferase family protein [Marinomonas vulgaris]
MKTLTILDGGMGRELKRIGAPFSQPLWSAQALIEAPEYVTQAHLNFIEAGAEIITVNSYACVPFHLGEALYNEKGSTLATQAAILAKDAALKAQHNVLVTGSLPPPFGSYRPDLFQPIRAKEILNTLFSAQDNYVDLWLAETIASIEEARLVQSIFEQTQKPCHYAFTLNDEMAAPARLRSGEPICNAIEAVITEKIDGIFFNCSIPEVIEQAICDTNKVLKKHNISVNIGVFANSFSPIPQNHQANENIQDYRDVSPEEYLRFAKRWHSLGANIIGGCCGIWPSHIKMLSMWKNKLLDNHQ